MTISDNGKAVGLVVRRLKETVDGGGKDDPAALVAVPAGAVVVPAPESVLAGSCRRTLPP